MTNLLDSQPTGPAVPLPPPGSPAARRPAGPPKRTSKGFRFLWKLFAAVLVIGTLVWVPYQVIVLLAHEERVENESFPAATLTTLELDGTAGTVQITAADTDTVHVRATISDGLRKTGESRRVVGDTLQLHSTCPNIGSEWCRVDYDVTMPAELAVVVRNGDGHTSISETTGPVDVQSDYGTVELSELSGTIDVATDNGRIEATGLTSSAVTARTDNGTIGLEFAAAPTTVRADTDNGRIEIVVPADGTAYRVDTSTDNGSRTVSVPIDAAGPRAITARTDNGSITVRTTAT
jgi:DUF4097 and DUF4098 domain-containing protein YvlB